MSPVRELNERESEVLRVLYRKAVTWRGWEWRGVRGWMLLDELNAAVRGWLPETLSTLARRGLIVRDRADDPGPVRARVLVTRITPAGLRHLVHAHGLDYHEIGEPGPPAPGVFFLPRGRWEIVRTLQRARRWREGGWLRAREIRSLVGKPVYEDEYLYLVKRALIEPRRTAPGGAGELRYRATAAGRRVQLLDGATSPDWVQVRLRAESAGEASGPKYRMN